MIISKNGITWYIDFEESATLRLFNFHSSNHQITEIKTVYNEEICNDLLFSTSTDSYLKI